METDRLGRLGRFYVFGVCLNKKNKKAQQILISGNIPDRIRTCDTDIQGFVV